MMGTAVHPLDALEQALNAERQALLDRDAERLLDSTQAKLRALRSIEALALDDDAPARVLALSELNQANAALLSRRRRELNWALRHLGMTEGANVYDAAGRVGMRPQLRSLGTG